MESDVCLYSLPMRDLGQTLKVWTANDNGLIYTA